MVYNFAVNPTATPQTEVIPGRENEMTKGKSGAVAFKVDDWTYLRRCLLLGTADGSYYAGKQELSQRLIRVIKSAVAADPGRVADEILYASDGHAVNNHAPILALVLLSCGDSPDAKKAFRRIFQKVVRTGSHFHEWISYTKSMRGIGRVIREEAINWLTREDVGWLSYQMLKYQQRYGFSFNDELRLFKPKPPTGIHQRLFGHVTGKLEWAGDNPGDFTNDNPMSRWHWYIWLKRNPEQGERAVREGALTHEMVAPIAKMDRNVWQALFESMPIGAMLRNLGSLTNLGVLRADEPGNLSRVAEVLEDPARIKKGRIHPIDALRALKVYQAGGKLGKSRKVWEPVPRICDILERCLGLSFDALEPTGKVFLHAVDVSGSMSCTPNEYGLTCAEIAATLALACAKTEDNYVIRGFSTEFIDLRITAQDSFSTALHKTSVRNFGSTDAAVAYEWAIQEKFKADVFCFWTDSESWAGRCHPSQALAKYRQKVNPEAKAIYTTLQVNDISLVDRKDSLSFDFGGFDPSLPKYIQTIANE